jgi:hypothetical protein
VSEFLRCPLWVDSVEKVPSPKSLQICQNTIDIFDRRQLPAQTDLEVATLSLGGMMRGPASAFENRTHGAEKIGLSRYSDFFNRIGHELPRRRISIAAAIPPKGDIREGRWRGRFVPSTDLSLFAS